MADRRPSSFRHHNTDISLDPLSTNRRFQPFTQLAGLGTMVVAGMTPESIQVLIPDCTERPVGDNVTVDLRHVVELFMGNSLDMGTELPATNLAEVLCPNSLAPTLILGQWEYWDEINPLLTKWRNVNKTRCPICARLIVFNMSRHLRLVHTTCCCYWRCPVPSCPSWFSSELNGKDHIENPHVFRKERRVSFYECLRRLGLEWFASRQFSDHKKTTGQLLWMDIGPSSTFRPGVTKHLYHYQQP